MSRRSARLMALRETDLLDSVVATLVSIFVAAFVNSMSPSYSPEYISSRSKSSRPRGASPREPAPEEEAGKLSPAAFMSFASSAAADRSLVAALLESLAAHRMDLLTMQKIGGMVGIDQQVPPFPSVTHWGHSFINQSLM